MKSDTAEFLLWLFGLMAIIWLAVSTLAYRFNHPEKTETELFMEIPRAVLWR